MFENLSERLSGVFDRLTKQGALSEEDVKTALREVRVALLEADVSLSVARDFVKAVQDKATGQAVTKSITPGQQVVKIVHDELVHVLAGDGEAGALRIDNPPKPRKNAPPKPKTKPVAAKKEVPKPKPKKPLSRLEKLRLIAKERAAERRAQTSP